MVAVVAGRRCPGLRCPTILTNGERYCLAHMAEHEAARGTSAQRGYGARHRAVRAQWQARFDRGEHINCARCGKRIGPREPWALDHDDEDRSRYLGPSHKRCNDSAGGTRGANASSSKP